MNQILFPLDPNGIDNVGKSNSETVAIFSRSVTKDTLHDYKEVIQTGDYTSEDTDKFVGILTQKPDRINAKRLIEGNQKFLTLEYVSSLKREQP